MEYQEVEKKNFEQNIILTILNCCHLYLQGDLSFFLFFFKVKTNVGNILWFVDQLPKGWDSFYLNSNKGN